MRNRFIRRGVGVAILFTIFYVMLLIIKPFIDTNSYQYTPAFSISSEDFPNWLLDKSYLKNQAESISEKIFKSEVERQAKAFSEVYFLEQPIKKRKTIKQIALTFDDSPDDWYCPQVLRILEKYKIKATFFLIGNRIKTYKHNALAIQNAGHLIGNHSFAHDKLTQITTEQMMEDLKLSEDVFVQELGIKPLLFRPPYGMISDEQIIELGVRGYKIINWSIDTYDWDIKRNSPLELFMRIEKYAHNGGIVLLHSSGKNRENTILALPLIIKSLRKRGYHFITLDKMLGLKPFISHDKPN
jgi:peptidoglycan/xylan/chitin deacetylase (PgdA/CDA1 family)